MAPDSAEPRTLTRPADTAGMRMLHTMIRVLEVWPDAPAPVWLVSQPEQCGVKNGYRNPAQLGSDRWAAMIGARALSGGKPTLVVVCGTAATIDFVNAGGEFTGGVILPGVGLMIRSLHEGTAALPDADGQFTDHPQQTVDAIVKLISTGFPRKAAVEMIPGATITKVDDWMKQVADEQLDVVTQAIVGGLNSGDDNGA